MNAWQGIVFLSISIPEHRSVWWPMMVNLIPTLTVVETIYRHFSSGYRAGWEMWQEIEDPCMRWRSRVNSWLLCPGRKILNVVSRYSMTYLLSCSSDKLSWKNLNYILPVVINVKSLSLYRVLCCIMIITDSYLRFLNNYYLHVPRYSCSMSS